MILNVELQIYEQLNGEVLQALASVLALYAWLTTVVTGVLIGKLISEHKIFTMPMPNPLHKLPTACV